MNKSFGRLLEVVVGVLAMGSALAADLPVEPQAVLSSWSGSYGGLSLGARSAGNHWRTSDVFPNFGTSFVPMDGSGGAMDSDAARIGAYLGHNWELATSWLAGIEVDMGWADNVKTDRVLPGTNGLMYGSPVDGPPNGYVKGSWDGSLRLRLGYLVSPDTLVYGAGGVAWQRLEWNASCVPGPVNSFCSGGSHDESHSSTRVGWTVGGGIEHRMGGNWVARLDYRYADYGTWTQQLFVPGGFGFGFDDRFTAHVRSRTHTATVGLSYRF